MEFAKAGFKDTGIDLDTRKVEVINRGESYIQDVSTEVVANAQWNTKNVPKVVGGHCIPIDPSYLSWKVKEVGFEARFIELAGQVNGAMPHHVVDKITDALNSRSLAVRGASVLVLGIAYKRDVDDIRESPALDVMAVLLQKGARVSYHDPFAATLRAGDSPGGQDLTSVALTPATLSAADCVVVITDHRQFDYAAIVEHAPLVVDTRNAIRGAYPHVFKLGAPVVTRTSSSRSSSRPVTLGWRPRCVRMGGFGRRGRAEGGCTLLDTSPSQGPGRASRVGVGSTNGYRHSPPRSTPDG